MPRGKPKGYPKPATSGRKKGVHNHVTVSIKDAITQAFGKLGGIPALVRWGKDHPDAFYALWSRMAPREVDVTSGGEPLKALIAAAFMGDDTHAISSASTPATRAIPATTSASDDGR